MLIQQVGDWKVKASARNIYLLNYIIYSHSMEMMNSSIKIISPWAPVLSLATVTVEKTIKHENDDLAVNKQVSAHLRIYVEKLPRGWGKIIKNRTHRTLFSTLQCVYHHHLFDWIDEYNYRLETVSLLDKKLMSRQNLIWLTFPKNEE